MRRVRQLAGRTEGSALVEFAIAVPLLVVFVVGIYDFSGAYNQKQKVQHAAQSGAMLAAAQPTGDMDPTVSDPDSLQPVLNVILNSLLAEGVLPQANQGSCSLPLQPPSIVANTQLRWTYTIKGCSFDASDDLVIVIDRGVVDAGPPATVSTAVTVTFPYHWRFNSVIQLLLPGASYAAITDVQETAVAHHQM